MHNTTPNGAVW
jgi:hypothetical protein